MELTTTKYKQTEVGLIPEDWQIKELNSLSDITRLAGFEYSTVWEETLNGEIIALRGFNIGNNRIIERDFVRISNKLSMRLIRSRLFSGDVIYPCVGTIGNAVAIEEDDKYHIQQNIAKITPYKKELDSKYLAYYLMSDFGFCEIRRFNGTSSQPNILVGSLRMYNIIVPTLEEQKTIAQVLSDTDALIQALEKKIAKKKLIKKGVMQRLLTPKKDWFRKTIKDLVSTPVTDGPHETPKFVKDGIPFLSVNNIVNNKIDKSDLRFISIEDDLIYSRKCKPQKNDILLGKAASVGKVAIVEDNWNFNIWSPLALIRTKDLISPFFLYYFFQTSDIILQIEGLTNSSSQGNIGMGDIEKLIITFPEKLIEQEEIANMFIDMDKEIEVLEQKLSKYQLAKQGMIQQLLTGKIRLV